ncbi:hypothetical protein KQ940_02470 [Marinobacterium sp. D7]|uniref:hypothetical protein n=1 Tax=Marinobacterium ramblicola TaxID=2849041 RepID=UPI001C2D7684|nr:hypothetical protein [Marinobacterium ramblicola]MBV1786909.1 hypothetical protein [Marinobacterium ramblicola]
MSGPQIFIIGLVLMLVLAVWNWQRSSEQRSALQGSGFSVTERLGGSPELLVDIRGRALAVVRPGGYERFSFEEFRSAELGYDTLPQADSHFRIELVLSNNRQQQIKYGSEWEAKRALERLQAIMTAP